MSLCRPATLRISSATRCASGLICERSLGATRGARVSALSPGDDGFAAALRLQPGGLLFARLAQACEERVDFMAVTAMNSPDFRTIASFRRRHLQALGVIRAGVEAVPGSGAGETRPCRLGRYEDQSQRQCHKAMSYGRMQQTEKKLAAEVYSWFAQRRSGGRRGGRRSWRRAARR